MRNRRAFMTMIAGQGMSPVVYTLRDEFTTNASAPLTSPRTCEPGPGTVTVTDATNVFSIANSKILASGTPAAESYIRTSIQLTQVAGQLVSAELAWTAGRPYLAFSTGAPASNNGNVIQVISSTRIDIRENGNGLATVFGSVPARFHIIKRPTAGYIFMCDNTIVWITNAGNAAQYASLAELAGLAVNHTWDGFRVVTMGAPWLTSTGIATNAVASPGANEVTTQINNAIVEMTHTMVTNDVWNFMVRRTDDSNCWIIRGDQAGSTIKLFEKNAGVETERGTSAQTWTNGTAYRLVVVMDGNTIRVITEVAGVPTSKISYTSATFNASATGVKTDLAGANLIAWPRVITGAALTELSRHLNP